MPIFMYSKVKPLRQAKGLNQGEIAAELGISRPTYVLMEQGNKEPTITQLYTLARLLGVEPGELCANLPTLSASMTDYPKFKDMVATCAVAGAADGMITKTKLSTLAYLVDFSWYALNKRPMTGALYRCTARGAVADDYFRALDELYEAQAIALEPSGAGMMVRPIEQKFGKLLTNKELTHVHTVCDKWRTESTEMIVNFSREQNPCKVAKSGDTIPYEAILNEPLDSLY